MPTAFVTGGSGFIGGALVRRLGADGVGVRPPFTRLAVWLSGLEATIDISRARTEVGYAPVRTLDEGLAELADEARRGERR
jgi:nucleoside-diphosphate-sugar epimerase